MISLTNSTESAYSGLLELTDFDRSTHTFNTSNKPLLELILLKDSLAGVSGLALLHDLLILWAREEVDQVYGAILADEAGLKHGRGREVLLLDCVFVCIGWVDGVVA